MTPDRNAALLAGQTAVAQKVYAVLPAGSSGAYSPLEIAKALKERTGASPDIHTMRGCLGRLKDAGLVKEIVPGAFRRVEVKEKAKMHMPKIAAPAAPQVEVVQAGPTEPMELLGGISTRLRTEARALMKIADDLDAGALVLAERAQKVHEEVSTVRQIAALLKGLG
ncbi:MAG: hypothetical protein ACN6OP_00390 [Pseudomonadales bacterium]